MNVHGGCCVCGTLDVWHASSVWQWLSLQGGYFHGNLFFVTVVKGNKEMDSEFFVSLSFMWEWENNTIHPHDTSTLLTQLMLAQRVLVVGPHYGVADALFTVDDWPMFNQILFPFYEVLWEVSDQTPLWLSCGMVSALHCQEHVRVSWLEIFGCCTGCFNAHLELEEWGRHRVQIIPSSRMWPFFQTIP